MHKISESIQLVEGDEDTNKGFENIWYVVNEETEPLLQMYVDREINLANIDESTDEYNKEYLVERLNKGNLVMGDYHPVRGDLLSLELRSVAEPGDFLFWYHFKFDGNRWKWVEHYIKGDVPCYSITHTGTIEFAFEESESPCWEDYQYFEVEEEETEEEKRKNWPKIPG